ncbi:hypothetical protein IAU60_005187 [Kwoniella sp. DSM 27419]
MPQTYPPAIRCPPETRQVPHPGYRRSGKTCRSPSTSSYLTPIQEARIDSWRQSTSGATPRYSRDHGNTAAPSGPGPCAAKGNVKSAPASISLSRTTKSSSCTCTCTCEACHGGLPVTPEADQSGAPKVTVVSPSGHQPVTPAHADHKSRKPPDNRITPRTPLKSYYSSTRKAFTGSPSPQLPLMTTIRPKTPPGGMHRINLRLANARAALRAPEGWDQKDAEGRPVNTSTHYHGDCLPPVQWPPAEGQRLPLREMAKPDPEKQLPRISGARDPISQN